MPLTTGMYRRRSEAVPSVTSISLPSGQSDYTATGLNPAVVTTASGSVALTTVGPKRVTVSDAGITTGTRFVVTVQRPTTADSGESGMTWVATTVSLSAGVLVLAVTPLSLGSTDQDLDTIPDESLTLHILYG